MAAAGEAIICKVNLMKIGEAFGYEVIIPTTGGKAGKGLAITGTVQLRHSCRIIKQFRFTWADKESRISAMRKAKAFAKANPPITQTSGDHPPVDA